MFQQRNTGLPLDRINSLLHEFENKFPLQRLSEDAAGQTQPIGELDQVKEEAKDSQQADLKDQPVEKKMKMNIP